MRFLAAFIACAALWLAPSAAQASFGLLPGTEGFSVVASEENGNIDNRAGSHPFALATSVRFNLSADPQGQSGGPFTDGDLRDLHIDLPPGLIENPAAVNKCSLAQFHTPRSSPFQTSLSGESCPSSSQIGVVAIDSSFGGGQTRTFGVFNLIQPPGFPSQFGFSPYGVPITFTPRIREAGGEYGLTLDARGFSQLFDLYGFRLSLWGTPWVVAHDGERGNCLNEVEPASPFGQAATVEAETPPGPPPFYKAGTCSIGNPRTFRPKAYLTLPTTCAAPMMFSLTADSWQEPDALATGTAQSRDLAGNPQSLQDCDRLAVDTVASVRPSTDRTSSSSGLDFNLDLNQEGLVNDTTLTGRILPEARAPSQVKKAVVALPAGMTINPSLAAGLGVCTPSQYAAETVSSPPGAGCPNAAKIGEILVQSPLFEKPVQGALFLAKPDDPQTPAPGVENPFDSLLALYIVAKAPEDGVFVKVAGQVSADPITGQLIAIFDGLPQLPYSHFNVHFREGQRSALATPAVCGSYTTQIELTPWLQPAANLHDSSTFQLEHGIGGGACPSGVTPFVPSAQAGTLNSNAGSYTPFYLHLTRTDADQEITSYSAKLAPGLLGKIAGIPYCPEADIAAAKRQSGTEETAHPSCPAASEIGHTVAGYGVGSSLTYAPGRLYLAGPFHGSSFSVVAIDSATVGPFDLGVIVVRSAIKVNPQTAQVSIDSAGSDPIPHIIKGIPLHLRDIRVYISRPEFTLNPTDCDPFSAASTLTGSAAPFTNPANATATATAPFQVSNCSSLGFAPRLSLKLKGGTVRGDYPSLTVTATPRPGDANIGGAAVTLPPSEFLAQNHIGTICTRSQFERSACPAASIYGHATAITPLLGEPMEGPVYLRSSSNPLPDLVAVLHGAGIEIDVAGRIDAPHGGLRGRFEVLPDAPVTRFSLTLNGGNRGILVNERNICTSRQTASARLVGQNNLGEVLKPRLQGQCKKRSKHSSNHSRDHGPAPTGR